MTAEEYRYLLAGLGLNQSAAAERLGLSIRTSNGYANDRPIPEPVARHLRLIAKERGLAEYQPNS
jgi:hypothetical protein